jgi:nitrile hydratase subunit alpha
MNRQAPAPIAARAAAVKQALVDKGLLTPSAINQIVHLAEEEWKPQNGARVVARAWIDSDFKARLLDNGTVACAELGYEGPQGEYIVAIEDTPDRHNVIVCTQCSCTAWPVIGLPTDWYKSPEYRARVVREPRPVLRELGLELPDDIAIRVWETNAETRYMVIPLRPAGSEGWTEEQLAELVTREALIGTAMALPAQ